MLPRLVKRHHHQYHQKGLTVDLGLMSDEDAEARTGSSHQDGWVNLHSIARTNLRLHYWWNKTAINREKGEGLSSEHTWYTMIRNGGVLSTTGARHRINKCIWHADEAIKADDMPHSPIVGENVTPATFITPHDTYITSIFNCWLPYCASRHRYFQEFHFPHILVCLSLVFPLAGVFISGETSKRMDRCKVKKYT